jgi:hypothetical protein
LQWLVVSACVRDFSDFFRNFLKIHDDVSFSRQLESIARLARLQPKRVSSG